MENQSSGNESKVAEIQKPLFSGTTLSSANNEKGDNVTRIYVSTSTATSALLTTEEDLDRHLSTLRTSLLELTKRSITVIEQRHTNELSQQKAIHDARIDSLEKEVSFLRAQLEKKSVEHARTDAQAQRLITHIHKNAQKRQEEKTSTKHIFDMWRLKADERKTLQKRATEMAQRNENTLRQSIFCRWQVLTLAKKSGANLRATISENNAAINRIKNAFSVREAELEMRIVEMGEALRREIDRRDLLEEQLKAAFLRGVCALNMEAMNVLRGNGEGGEGGDDEAEKDQDQTRVLNGCDAKEMAAGVATTITGMHQRHPKHERKREGGENRETDKTERREAAAQKGPMQQGAYPIAATSSFASASSIPVHVSTTTDAALKASSSARPLLASSSSTSTSSYTHHKLSPPRVVAPCLGTDGGGVHRRAGGHMEASYPLIAHSSASSPFMNASSSVQTARSGLKKTRTGSTTVGAKSVKSGGNSVSSRSTTSLIQRHTGVEVKVTLNPAYGMK